MPAIPGVRFELRTRIGVTVSSRLIEHVNAVRVNVATEPDPGDAFGAIALVRKDGTPVDLETATLAYWAALLPLYSSTVDFVAPQLWRADVGSTNFTLISEGSLSDQGGSGSGIATSRYVCWTWRCVGGSTLKVLLLETVLTNNDVQTAPVALTASQDVFDYVNGDTSPIISAQGAVPLAAYRLSGGEHEAIWYRRNRQ